jgi:hypothetical protein
MPKGTEQKDTTKPSFPDTYYSDPRGIDRYVVQEKELYAWRSPSKIERARTLTEKKQLILIAVFMALVLVLLGELMIAVMFMMICIVYALLAAAPPTYLDCEITTLGVKVGEKYYFWPDMSQFWWEEHGDNRVLYFRVIFPDFATLRLVVPKVDEEKIETTIGTYLLYKKPQQTKFEKWKKELLEKLPIDLEFLRL